MKNTRQLVRAALFIALMTMGATLRITVGVVPFTFQAMIAGMAGILLGAKWGALAIIGYLFLGLMGLPLFAEGGGIGYLFKPTFGYLLGFIPGAFAAGWISRRKNTFGQVLYAMGVSLAIIYFIGVSFLSFFFIFVQGVAIGFGELLAIGLLPFIGPDLLMGFLGALLAFRLRKTTLFE